MNLPEEGTPETPQWADVNPEDLEDEDEAVTPANNPTTHNDALRKRLQNVEEVNVETHMDSSPTSKPTVDEYGEIKTKPPVTDTSKKNQP